MRSLRLLLLGPPLSSEESRGQQIGSFVGIGLLGLDALASAAYGPEAALTVLLRTGQAGVDSIRILLLLVAVVLVVVCLSYRQTIMAYPNGGGSYVVAKENLGTGIGLLAGAGLCLDYVLNVAVAISAGVGALVSMWPALQPQTLALCLGMLVLLTIVNLRGVRDAGLAFVAPTWIFVVSFLACVALGVGRTIASGGSPHAIVEPPHLAAGAEAPSAWLLLRAFASGCSAMTGVEAVSNAVPIFRPPSRERARFTLSLIVFLLLLMIGGVAVLCPAYGIGATEPGKPGYQSVLSQIVAAAVGRGPAYFVAIGATVAVLGLSANTSFAGFPRVCRLMAADKFLPEVFAHRGPRLVFSRGIVALSIMAGALLAFFHGITDKLIPLFAIGAFLSFTLSQAGMVAHWRRTGGRGAVRSQWMNGIGAVATAGTLLVVMVSKFGEGAWITLLLIPATLVMLRRFRRHEQVVIAQTALDRPLQLDGGTALLVVVPMRRWDRVAEKGLRLALELSTDVHAVQVLTDLQTKSLADRWSALVEEPARRAGRGPPELHVLTSRYRELIGPLFRYVCGLRDANPSREIAVILPELVERRWYHYLFRHHTSAALAARLLFRAGPRVFVIQTPWYLHD